MTIYIIIIIRFIFRIIGICQLINNLDLFLFVRFCRIMLWHALNFTPRQPASQVIVIYLDVIFDVPLNHRELLHKNRQLKRQQEEDLRLSVSQSDTYVWNAVQELSFHDEN